MTGLVIKKQAKENKYGKKNKTKQNNNNQKNPVICLVWEKWILRSPLWFMTMTDFLCVDLVSSFLPVLQNKQIKRKITN